MPIPAFGPTSLEHGVTVALSFAPANRDPVEVTVDVQAAQATTGGGADRDG